MASSAINAPAQLTIHGVEYTLVKMIRKGGNGVVSLYQRQCLEQQSDQVAVKFIWRVKENVFVNEVTIQRIMSEAEPSLFIRYIDHEFRSPNEAFLVTEFVPHPSAWDYIAELHRSGQHGLSEEQCKGVFVKLIQGLSAMHQRNIVHR